MESTRNPSAKRPLDHGSPDSPLLKRLRPEELLELLEHDAEPNALEADVGGERVLESLIRSFEEEIAGEGELGFLLHASDDELGLPPPCESVETVATEAEAEVGGDVAEVRDEVVEKVADVENTFDSGLFGWCDEGLYAPLDLSDLTWKPMPAV
jgi:hypothetical protein